jgi:multiple sugar transport system ATP-binding protein
VNLFVAGFIGSPAMNMIEATVARTNGTVTATVGSQRLELTEETLSARPALKRYDGRTVVLGIRPEDLEDAELASETPPERRFRGQVTLTEALGSEIIVHFTTDAKQATTEDVRELAADAGDDRLRRGEEQAQAALVGRFGARSRVRSGQTAEVAVDSRALHFFDPETGLGIYDEKEEKGAAT